MNASDLVESQQYVVTIEVAKDGEDEHPQLDPGDVVTCVNPNADDDGEVYVTATLLHDNEALGAWVKPEYLMTLEEAETWVKENSHMVDEVPGFFGDPEEEQITEYPYTRHPDYPNLPTYETLPLGYALGIVGFIKGLGAKPVDPVQALLQHYRQGRGFPTV